MLVIKLKDAMEAYRRNSHERMTYEELARRTGIAAGTLRRIGSKLGYHTSLANIEKICRACGAKPGDILELIDDPLKAKRAGKKKRSE